MEFHLPESVVPHPFGEIIRAEGLGFVADQRKLLTSEGQRIVELNKILQRNEYSKPGAEVACLWHARHKEGGHWIFFQIDHSARGHKNRPTLLRLNQNPATKWDKNRPPVKPIPDIEDFTLWNVDLSRMSEGEARQMVDDRERHEDEMLQKTLKQNEEDFDGAADDLIIDAEKKVSPGRNPGRSHTWNGAKFDSGSDSSSAAKPKRGGRRRTTKTSTKE